MRRGSAGCAGAGAASICHPEGLNLLKQRFPLRSKLGHGS